MTGNRMAHPLLISLANIRMDVRTKYSNNAFILCALLPVAQFIHKKSRMRGLLNDRLLHYSLDVVLEPLKIAARIGIMMSDPLGSRRFCFTPLAAYIADTQEAVILACVGGKTSPLTMATYKQFGDSFQHEPRTASTTLAQIQTIGTNPDDIELYFKEAKTLRLNGVHLPFWRDWLMADPARFLTPEPLHHWHRQFWDHDAQWCIHALGAQEIDFRFSVLPCTVGFRHFNEGISKLKQVTGKEQRDVERYVVGVIAGAVPKDFVIAIRALMDFRYLSQAPVIDDNVRSMVRASLLEFHEHKDAILDAGGRLGKGNRPIENWYIPKLEMMQSVDPSIPNVGSVLQWSADLTEHAHITEVKHPSRSSNNQKYDPQICRYLDRREKCRRFDLATSTRQEEIDVQRMLVDSEIYPNQEDEDDVQGEAEDTKENHSPEYTADIHSARPVANYFSRAERLARGLIKTAPYPYRTFSNSSTAFHLSRDPSCKMLVDEAARVFHIPDLRPALADYLSQIESGRTGFQAIRGRRTAPQACHLPFDSLHIWYNVRMQGKLFHDRQNVAPPQTLHSSPPSTGFPLGRFDTAFVNDDPSFHWPDSGFSGVYPAQIL